MMSASPASFAGEYVTFENNHVLAINIRPKSAANSYTGDVDSSGVDSRFTATESSAGVLTGKISASGKRVPFDATLSGTTLTFSYSSVSIDASQVSATPAPLPPALARHSRSEFKYSAPGNWKISVGSDGIVMSSPNGTEQVGVIATVADGVYTASQIANSEVAGGGTILSSKYLADGLVSSTEYKQAGIGELQFTSNGTPDVSGQIIETLNFAGVGTYDSQTGKYSGETVTLLFEVTAPKAQFAAACPTLIDMLTSVQPNSAAKPAKTPVQSKSHVPGLSGNWSSSAAFAKDEDEYAATIEAETLSSEDSIDSSVDSFCDFLTS